MTVPLWPLLQYECVHTLTQGRFFMLNALAFVLAALLTGGYGLWGILALLLFINAPRIFEDDLCQGRLEQISLLPCSLPLVVWMKLSLYWVLGVLPLVGIIALFTPTLSWIQGLGSLNLTLLAGLGAALAQQGANRGLVNVLILIPLSVPLVLLLNTQDPGVTSVHGTLMIAYFFFITPLVFLVAPWALREEMASR